ncbi:MAG: DUF3782 domain-containing protein [Pyrobaculum sp.]
MGETGHGGDVGAVGRETEALRRELADISERMATKDDVARLDKEVEDIGEKMATKEGLFALERRVAAKFDAVDNELKALEIRPNLRLEALSARWGLASERAFREAVRELLREAGYAVEKWVYFDSEGHVYGQTQAKLSWT